MGFLSPILSLFSGIWGRIIWVVVGVVSVLAAVLTVRARVRDNAKGELSREIQERTLERIEEARRIDAEPRPANELHERMRDKGYFRE